MSPRTFHPAKHGPAKRGPGLRVTVACVGLVQTVSILLAMCWLR